MDDGDVVYVVGRTPVRVVEAAEPFWRDLVRDAAGKDVVPLQRLLIADGHLSGEADGTFGPATERAVKAWQKNQGVDQAGSRPAGAATRQSRQGAVPPSDERP